MAEEHNVTFLVLPAPGDVPASVKDKEAILREEAREYDQARNRVEESKKKERRIPDETVEKTYALMIGHTALSPTSRPSVPKRPR